MFLKEISFCFYDDIRNIRNVERASEVFTETGQQREERSFRFSPYPLSLPSPALVLVIAAFVFVRFLLNRRKRTKLPSGIRATVQLERTVMYSLLKDLFTGKPLHRRNNEGQNQNVMNST